MIRAKPLHELLIHAASLIDANARALKECHTIRGRWPVDAALERAEYEDMRATAKALLRAAAYSKQNSLGGPAVILEAAAQRIRAGDPFDAVLADYGLQVKA